MIDEDELSVYEQIYHKLISGEMTYDEFEEWISVIQTEARNYVYDSIICIKR